MNRLTDLLRKHRKASWAAGAALAAVLLYLWLGSSAQAPVSYRTEPVSRGDLRVTVSATGNVAPTNQVDVGSEQSGIVAAVLVDENDTVKQGQVLARLDTAKLANAVTRAGAALASAEAGARQADATAREARAERERLRKVHELSGGKVPSATDLEAADAALARSEAAAAAARAAIAEARATLQSANTDLAKAHIRSPINGVVLSRQIEPGQTVAASLQAPVLFTLAEDLTRMELEVDIDEADVGKVKTGQAATFTVDAWPNREYPATLLRVSYGSRVTEGVVSYEAVLAVDNKDLSLRPGMTATATIDALERRNVLLVPNAALRFTPSSSNGAAQQAGIVSKLMPRPPQQKPKVAGNNRKGGKQQVWVLDNGQPHAIDVAIGETNGRVSEIISGELGEGSAVIVGTEGTGKSP